MSKSNVSDEYLGKTETTTFIDVETRGPNVQIDKLPHVHIDKLPSVHIEKLPNVHIDKFPNLHIDEAPNVYIGEEFNVHIDESPNGALGKAPNVHIDRASTVQIDEAPDFDLEKAPNVQIGKAPNVHIDKLPDVHIDKLPNVHIDELSNVHINKLPDVYIGEKAYDHIEKLPNVQLDEASNVYIGEEAIVHIDKAPKVDLGKERNMYIDKAPNVDLGKSPDVDLGKAPYVHIDKSFNVDLYKAPYVDLGKAPNVHIDKAPNVDLRIAPNVHIDKASNVDLDKAPNVDLGEEANLHIDEAIELLDNEYGSRHLRSDVEDDDTIEYNVHIDEEAAVRQYRRQLYDELKNNITLHGYRQLSIEKGWRKLFWILSMTILTVFAVYLSYHMLRDFGYRTALEYEYEEGLSHLDYPTITICGNMPVYSPMSFKKFSLNITLDEFKAFYKEILQDYGVWTEPSNASQAIFQGLYKLNITSYKDILILFVNTIEDAMDTFPKPMCFYEGPDNCNITTDFKETLMLDGNSDGNSLCHQWNYYDQNKMSKRQTKDSRFEKLTMFLDVHADHQLKGAFAFDTFGLYIHPYGTPHYIAKQTESIGLQTGKYTVINIDLTERNLLPSPYSTNCGTKELKIIKNFPYSQARCEIDCILVKMYKKCECISFEFEGYISEDIPICPIGYMYCYNVYAYIAYLECVKHTSATCPRECTYYQYNVQTSRVMDIANKRMYAMLHRSKSRTKDLEETKNYFKRNVVGFNIGYKSLSKKIENYVPLVTPSGLIGTLGGSIGLCLGFSFVTAFEVIVFIYDYATARWKVKARK